MKTQNRLYVDVHVLQTVPPSCINRDDTGSPKTAVYGGVTRARVSSQSWKKAIRDMFKQENIFSSEMVGNRTKKLTQEVAKVIRDIDTTINEKESEKLAQDTINIASTKASKPIVPTKKKSKDEDDNGDTEESAALFFITPKQVFSIAELAVQWKRTGSKPSRDSVCKALLKDQGVDIALFGRMVAQAPDINVNSCAQVAHSISTHKVSNEYDYFTAVDDLAPEDSAGAGHIGTVEFNSATLYRYATVAVHELLGQLGVDTIDAIREFVRAFVYSMPTGKQNTFANRTLPDAVLVTVRTDQPINLVGAFERPVPADDGYVAISVKRLIDHAASVHRNFAGDPVLTLMSGEVLAAYGSVQPFPTLLQTLSTELARRLDGEQK